jgi:hypothetical protein
LVASDAEGGYSLARRCVAHLGVPTNVSNYNQLIHYQLLHVPIMNSFLSALHRPKPSTRRRTNTYLFAVIPATLEVQCQCCFQPSETCLFTTLCRPRGRSPGLPRLPIGPAPSGPHRQEVRKPFRFQGHLSLGDHLRWGLPDGHAGAGSCPFRDSCFTFQVAYDISLTCLPPHLQRVGS